ncbi:MAG: Eco57I restriction-modification methylase domain-containing protein [Methylococcales bacterium]|nr:Eco57I restriction-modification methylase domain-containing protein [Methylococcales bacterium]
MLNKLNPRQSLNVAFLKIKPHRDAIEHFKTHANKLLNAIKENESEEYHKNCLTDFLKDVYYKDKHYINTKGRNDLVIHNDKDAASSVGVIIEAKSPINKMEMLRCDNINKKAMQELVLYYLRERLTHKNIHIKRLIATNINEWFIFDAQDFEKYFIEDKQLVKDFIDFENGVSGGNKTDFFYKNSASTAIEKIKTELKFTYFTLHDYKTALQNDNKESDKTLIPLFKCLSPEHLLKLPFSNDSNSLNKDFYNELLHIIGLTEIKVGGKKLIERKSKANRDEGSLLEKSINEIESLDKLRYLPNLNQYGANKEEQLFTIGLELTITWINRVLFLKLLEAQLISYHQGDNNYGFLNSQKITNFGDLNSLFFQVLACKPEERREKLQHFHTVPYLNSSLFEPTELEQKTLSISNLNSSEKLAIFTASVLKTTQGKKQTGELETLDYLFEFLNAYDFASEGTEDIQEENKTLINASVLGLIFEKINGYKDGSFFTPSFITMYMSRETLRRAVVQKFNESKGWQCQTIAELDDYIDVKDRQEANDIINSLKICDPAVGSGHFLVSVLNEIIAIKSELKLLQDCNGKRLKEYDIKIINDELIITDEDGLLFEYKPNSAESQRVQEALFHEKQTLIENCLFGVDINPNSVKICRLRLWIELLKNTYYINDGSQFRQLETLPNIDINIQCGNSLISRFALDVGLKTALKKSKPSIDAYKKAFDTYRNAKSKEEKREMEQLIAKIKGDFRTEIHNSDPKVKRLNSLQGDLVILNKQTSVFEESPKEKKLRKQQTEKLELAINKLNDEIEDIKNNKIYENAFEWRFEFPEVLNDKGDFIGFDVMIGNPPYIQIQKFSGNGIQAAWQNQQYVTFEKTGDIYALFIEKGIALVKPQGLLTFITSNKWMRAGYGQSLRQFLAEKTQPLQLIDFGDSQLFDNATTYTNILITQNGVQDLSWTPEFNACSIQNDFSVDINLADYFFTHSQCMPKISSEVWVISSTIEQQLKAKIEAIGTPLKDWDININYGIKTGFNEAFIIDTETKERLCLIDPKSAEIIKPILRGRDIKRYSVEWAGLWIIFIPWHFPLHEDSSIMGVSEKAESEFEKQYPAIYQHLTVFKKQLSARNKAETGIRYEWYALQRCAATYWQEFEKEKIIYAEIVFDSAFYFDTSNMYAEATNFILTGENLKYLIALLNSKLLTFVFKSFYAGGDLRGNTFRYKKAFLDKLPILKISEKKQQPFINLVDKILANKKAGNNTSALEREIDKLVYQLYGLSEEEILIVEGGK